MNRIDTTAARIQTEGLIIAPFNASPGRAVAMAAIARGSWL